MPRRSVDELRRKGVFFPHLGVFFESYFTMAVTGAVGLVALTVVTADSLSALGRIQNPPRPESQYAEVQAAVPPSEKWAKAFVSAKPPVGKGWNVSSDKTARNVFSFDDCSAVKRPKAYHLSTFAARNDAMSLSVDLVSPGQSAVHLDDLVKTFKSCWNVNSVVDKDNKTEVYSFARGAVFMRGDSVFTVVASPSDQKKAVKWALDNASRTLSNSGCSNLWVVPKDVERNPYVDPKTYRGKFSGEDVATTVVTTGFPTQVFPEVKELVVVDEPEGPLPEKFPVMPTAPMEEPPVTPVEEVPEHEPFSKYVSYRVMDPSGPGCGWKWSGMTGPVEDAKKIAADKSQAIKNTKSVVDNNAIVYRNARLGFVRDSFMFSSVVNQWNGYVDAVGKVNAKREWLESERDKIRDSWFTYVEEHNDWVNFDNLQANAIKQYNAEVTLCNKANEESQKWDEQYANLQSPPEPPLPSDPTPVPNPSDNASEPPSSPSETPSTEGTTTPSEIPSATPEPTVNIPPRPVGCTVAPTKDPIIDRMKPDEPQAPKIPEGVTIPESWDRPITEPTVQLI